MCAIGFRSREYETASQILGTCSLAIAKNLFSLPPVSPLNATNVEHFSLRKHDVNSIAADSTIKPCKFGGVGIEIHHPRQHRYIPWPRRDSSQQRTVRTAFSTLALCFTLTGFVKSFRWLRLAVCTTTACSSIC